MKPNMNLSKGLQRVKKKICLVVMLLLEDRKYIYTCGFRESVITVSSKS